MYHAKHPEGSRKKIYTANNGAVGKILIFFVKSKHLLTIAIDFLAGAFMGFDSELEDSASECDVEGQRMDAVQAANLKTTAILDSPDHLPIFEGIFYIFFREIKILLQNFEIEMILFTNRPTP